MQKINLIPATVFCSQHEIEMSFLNVLKNSGMIDLTLIEDTEYIYESQLVDIEKMINMYFELDINIEGIETISRLLKRINDLQEENTFLRNKVRFYKEYTGF